MKNIKSILISAGGTAGHAIPAIEVANELARRNYKVIFITDNRMFDFIKINTRENSSIKVLCFKGRGLYKSKIFKNLSADKAGLKLNDIIISINEKELNENSY